MRRGEKFEGVCLKHGEQLHYRSNGKCLVCERGWNKPKSREEHNEYMKKWFKVRRLLGKKVCYETKEHRRKRNKEYNKAKKERKLDEIIEKIRKEVEGRDEGVV